MNAPKMIVGDNQLKIPGVECLRKEVEEPANVPVKKFGAGIIHMLQPGELTDHPRNRELFGESRLAEVNDLVLSLSNGFDPSRPIKAVQRAEGLLVILDGHRRRRAAETLGLEKVPVVFGFEGDEQDEKLEMITANLVRNEKHRSVGLGTAVRLIQLLCPREVKLGRPANASKKKDRTGQLSEALEAGESKMSAPDARRKYYANLLALSENKFRKADYVLRHGTKEEVAELDTGLRSTDAIYKVVLARVKGESDLPAEDPREIVKAGESAARTIISVRFKAGEPTGLSYDEVDEDLDILRGQARQEAGGAVSRGTTARGISLLLRRLAA